MSAAPAWIGIISSRAATIAQCIHSAPASIAHRWVLETSCIGSKGQGIKPAAASCVSRAVAEIMAHPDSGRPNRQM
ncbi:hypothetical protein D3C80_2135160 [compost metagenome]